MVAKDQNAGHPCEPVGARLGGKRCEEVLGEDIFKWLEVEYQHPSFQIFNDEEIMQTIDPSSDINDADNEDQDFEDLRTISQTEGVQALTTALKYLEQRSDVTPIDLLLKNWRDGAATDRNSGYLQRKAGEEEIYQSSEPQQVVNIFRDENACPDDIDEAGEKVLIALYGRKKSVETRDSLIFKLFQKSLVKNNFILVFLPPTTSAAREHSLRAYLQVQHWSGFDKRPLDWCWKETKHGLFSVTTHKEPASPALFSMISLQVRKRV
ncbi:hypothetical protein AVEN_238367-1 [Araneus ventricosus]|uniref:Uncharacterized protein n=1 Tax=Araneus ventricosus TaxID=182803 RepID=A0A4Y2LJ81_ARAVE|nr:hypothetical protein AVEN_238367-1 [Araneus ventricosus]